MSVEEAKKRALAIVREKGLDVALITAYLETRHYPSWSQRDDFAKYNIGLSGISGGPMPVTVGFTRGNGRAVTAELDGNVFTLRGVWYLPMSFDSSDAATVYEGVEMLLDDDVVLACVYLARDHEACIPAQFSMVSVEAYHSSPTAEQLLAKISDLVKTHKAKQAAERQAAETEKYRGKFSFD
ncbi:hypothetical protein [Paraburkholderia sediminicola]|uniref:hypothetical protein n=1 Tax=Paraburkholderia sediminicola TaxID=458836 RepID=UPI0038B703DD